MTISHIAMLASRMQANMEIHPFLFDWMLAMKVTFAEAYLESALLLLTAANPALMATHDKVISGDDVLNIEAEPPEVRWQSLMLIMRQRWTTQFLRGKPGEWISRLHSSGVINGFVEATDAFVVSALESLRSFHAVGGQIPSTPR